MCFSFQVKGGKVCNNIEQLHLKVILHRSNKWSQFHTTSLLIPAIIVGNVGSQNVISIWFDLSHEDHCSWRSSAFIVRVTHASEEVYYVREIYEHSLGLQMKKWPREALFYMELQRAL